MGKPGLPATLRDAAKGINEGFLPGQHEACLLVPIQDSGDLTALLSVS